MFNSKKKILFPAAKRVLIPLAVICLVSIAFVAPKVASQAVNIYEKIQVLNQMIAIVNENYVEQVSWDEVLDGAFHGLLEKLDPHSAYIPRTEIESVNEVFRGSFEGIGIEFDILGGYITVIAPIEDSPSARAGIQPGDQITEINGESAYKITKSQVFEKLRGPKGTKVTITVQRIGLEEPFSVEITRDQIPIHSVSAGVMIDDKTGYIRLNRFSSTTAQEIKETIEKLTDKGLQQLILDLRSNSGGYLEQAVEVTDQLITTGDTLVYTAGRRLDTHEVYRDNPQTGSDQSALIILVDRWSASASEIVAGAVQDLDRGLIIGETTFGKGLVQRQWMLKDESALRLTVARYYTPSGRLIQRPYDNGAEAYYKELTNPNRQAQLDSLKRNLPPYTTKSGRVVYGGGGIMPDIFLPEAELTASTTKIFRHPDRLIFEWATQIALKQRTQWASLQDFKNNFQIGDEQYRDFIQYVRSKNSEVDSLEAEKDKNILKNYLKAEIANSLWGRQGYYEVQIQGDSYIRSAMNYFDEAKAFLAKR